MARKAEPPPAVPNHPGYDHLLSKGCVASHDLLGHTRRVGPALLAVGERLSAADIRQSIVDPNAVIAEGFPPGLMLQDFADTLAPEELDQLVGYLSGEVPLGERLNQPGVHLLALILLFNGGVYVAMRMVAG